MAESSSTDRGSLAEALGALSSNVRIALLEALRTPKTLGDIVVRMPEEASGTARPLARQTIRAHLDKLVEVGLVIAQPIQGERGPSFSYALNHRQIYALAEDLRTLALLRPTVEVSLPTVQAGKASTLYGIEGPCLVQVKGLEEGKTYGLRPSTGGRGQWVIGRKRGTAVAIDFDPFVSTENAVIRLEGGAYTVEDLPESRNGTFLNFRPVMKGQPQPLENGDVVGVGRTLLLFRVGRHPPR